APRAHSATSKMQDVTAFAISPPPSQQTQTPGSAEAEDVVKHVDPHSGCAEPRVQVDDADITAVELGQAPSTTPDPQRCTRPRRETGEGRIIPVVLMDRPGGGYWKTWFGFLGDYLLKLGLVSENDFKLFKMTATVDEAIEEIVQFYRNYHSYRWVRQRIVFRLLKKPTPAALEKLNTDFADLIAEGQIALSEALPEEANEPDIANLPRLVLAPHRR